MKANEIEAVSMEDTEMSSNDISTTNITPEDITDQLDELMESAPKKMKSE